MAGESLQGARVLVTGAGLVGTRLVNRLAADGVKSMRVFETSADRIAALGGRVEAVVGDVTDPDAAKRAMQGIDVVFHTAGVLEGNDVAAYHRVNHIGTEVMARAAAEAKVGRFVHVSSVAVYGYASGDISETRPVQPKPEAYSQSKALGEAAVLRVGAETGMPVVAIRPAGVFGPGSRYFSGTFMKRALKRPIKMVGNGKGSQPVIFVDDLVDLMATVAIHPKAGGEVFNCAVDPSPTVKEYLHTYGRLVGNETWFGIPTALIATLGSVIVPISKKDTYGRHLPKNMRMIDKTINYKMDKARTLLGWKPNHDVAAGVAATVPWLREQGILPAK
jgi:nucleoside-diphosphate-sugar epimerase